MKIICIGRNYLDHINELNNQVPEEPVIFLKPDTAILRNNEPFYYPDFSKEIHHEVELLVKICKEGKYIQEKFAHKYYEEIGLGIDFTARDLQNKLKSKGLPWEKSKAFDGSAVIGDFIHKVDLPSIDNLNFELTTNGVSVQKASTKLMLWNIDELVSNVSQYFTLKIGDVIFTGTPAGVAKVISGDVLEGYLEGRKLFRTHVK